MNYFELFDIPVSLRVDKRLLAKKYFELQKKYHPDFYSQSDEAEKEDALEMSSRVNLAYKIFLNDDATIQYVLKLHQLIEEEEKYQLPQEFLMQMMDLNEELPEENEDTRSKVEQLKKEMYEAVKPVIDNYKEAVTTEKELLQIKNYYYQKKYLNRITGQLNGMS